jgi:hypothetical protein
MNVSYLLAVQKIFLLYLRNEFAQPVIGSILKEHPRCLNLFYDPTTQSHLQ